MNPAIQSKATLLLVCIGFILVGGGAYFAGKATTKPSAMVSEVAKTEENAPAKGTVKFESETLRLASLEISHVRETPLATRLTVTGEVEPNRSGIVKVTPRTEGKLIKLLVNVGDAVRAGQTLAVVQSEKLHEAQVAYRLNLKKVALAHNTLQRRKKLAALGEYGRPSIEDARTRVLENQGMIDKERNEVATAQSVISEMESQLHALEAAQQQARIRQATAQSRSARAEALFKEQLMSRQEWEQAQADVLQMQSDVMAGDANLAQGVARIESARSRSKAAKAAFESARKRGDVLQQALVRSEAVYKGEFLSSKEVAEADSALQQAQIEADGALDDIELMGGSPGDFHSIPVISPIDGRVTERPVTLGETVAADKPLLVVMNARTVWVQLNVFPKDAPALRVGQKVQVTTTTRLDSVFKGMISYISDTEDETTRTVKVRCVMQNETGSLKPGAFVTGKIFGASGKPALTVPKDAVQYVNGKPVVYVPTQNEGEFRAQPVEIGEKHEDLIEIRSGLKAGDRLVTKNAFLVKSQAMKSELGEE